MDENLSYGNPLDTPPEEPADQSSSVVGHLIGLFSRWEQARSSLEVKWDEYYRTWRCIEDVIDKTRQSERCQLKIPATKEAINNAVDSIYQIVFGAEPFFKLNPILPINPRMPPLVFQQIVESKDIQMRLMEAYLQWIMGKDDFEGKVHAALTTLARDGTTVARVVAKPYIKKTTEKEPMTGVPIPTEEASVRPCLEHIPLQNFYIDPFSPDIQSAEGCFVKSFKKTYELTKLLKSGVIQRVPETYGTAANDRIRENRLQRVGIIATPSTDDVELLEYWGWMSEEELKNVPEEFNFPINSTITNDGGAEVVAIIANRKHLLSLQPNPYYSQERPFVKDCYEEVPGEFYGIGIVEIASGPQRALNATVRSRIDNKALSINQLFAVNVDKFLPGQNLSMYPGKVFLFRGSPSESLMPIQVPDVTSSTYNDAAEYERYIQSSHGISRIVGGMPSKQGEQTATEISALMNQSNSRIKTLVKSFENNFIEPALRWYVRIAYQFMAKPEIFRLLSGEMIQVDQKDITEDYDFTPMGSASLAARGEFQKRMSILQASANPVDMQFVNRPYMWKKAYETLNLGDVDAAILGQPPVQQQAMGQQQMQSEGPGATGPQTLAAPNEPPAPLAFANTTPATNTSQQPGQPLIGEM